MIYEYECTCKQTTELQRKVAQRDDPVICTCGKPMERKVSAANFSLKGDGWYADGYSTPKKHE